MYSVSARGQVERRRHNIFIPSKGSAATLRQASGQCPASSGAAEVFVAGRDNVWILVFMDSDVDVETFACIASGGHLVSPKWSTPCLQGPGQ